MIDVDFLIQEFNIAYPTSTTDTQISQPIKRSTEGSADDMAQFVMKELVISVHIMRLANSKMPDQISSLSSAINFLGTRHTSEAINTAISLTSQRGSQISTFEVTTYKRQSLFCALTTKHLSKLTGDSATHDPETAFVIGLLSTVGNILLLNGNSELHYSKHYEGSKLPWDIQKECTGIDQYELAARLLAFWRIPRVITQPIKHLGKAAEMDAFPYIKQLYVATSLSLLFVHAENYNIADIITDTLASSIGLTKKDLSAIYRDCAIQTINQCRPRLFGKDKVFCDTF